IRTVTMTLADQAAMRGQDGRVTDEKPSRPKRRTFTAAYKARILAAYDALPEGSAERGALMRAERLYHSHIEHWRKQAENGTLGSSTGKPKKDAESEEIAALRAENRRLKAEAAKLEARNERLADNLGKTRTALDIAGKAFALLENISSSADSDES
ncbi:transposase, partial [Actinocorallia sp. B10E7]|uniref:transposase n=1 Tax=Actinocorallia sp. B10E7 TaxID=3153558 RepID=UPI00325F68F7